MDGAGMALEKDLAVLPCAAPLDFPHLYAAWFRVVHRWVASLGGSADTEDLVQEIFVIVQRKLLAFDGANPGGWLYRITRRTVRDHRQKSWFRRVLLGSDRTLERVEDEGADSAAQLEQKEARARFYRIVERMSDKWRETFVLFEIAGHSGEEIAALTGLPPATVRTHLHRARKQFLALVAEELES
jgi:RNA polymerase sigma-70 factor (ECF subfamily)